MEYINNETREIMTRDEAVDWLYENIGIDFQYTIDSEKMRRQAETEEILLEAYFWTQETKERVYEEDDVQVIDLRI